MNSRHEPDNLDAGGRELLGAVRGIQHQQDVAACAFRISIRWGTGQQTSQGGGAAFPMHRLAPVVEPVDVRTRVLGMRLACQENLPP